MKRTQILIGLLLFAGIIFTSACKKNNFPDLDFRQEMRNFVQEISTYSKNIDSDFLIIPQNGADLVSSTGDEDGTPELTYINAIDGIGQEDLLYGYDDDDRATASDVTTWLSSFLNIAKSNGGVRIMVTDYCSTQSKMDDSFLRNNNNGYISFAADHRDLNNIPTYPSEIYNENSDVITNLQEAKNFLYLICPDDNFSTKQEFVDAIANTNYDYIIMDFFYDNQEFTVEQILQLKQKANGGQRLLICYMSIGEAEDYRYYWNNDWDNNSPNWLEKENPNWRGNYKVRYWEEEWKDIIFGNDNSYLKKIIDAGFDGVYLDIIDAFEYFE